LPQPRIAAGFSADGGREWWFASARSVQICIPAMAEAIRILQQYLEQERQMNSSVARVMTLPGRRRRAELRLKDPHALALG
jgi:hypothetical protein